MLWQKASTSARAVERFRAGAKRKGSLSLRLNGWHILLSIFRVLLHARNRMKNMNLGQLENNTKLLFS